MRPTPGAGTGVLSMPSGDPGAFWAGAATLRAAAATLAAAPVATSTERLATLGAWTGAAAGQAAEEYRLVGLRAGAAADRVVQAAAALATYGDALDAAQRSVASLQTSWDSAVAADPLGQVAAAADLSRLAGTHTAVVSDLELAAHVAAQRLRALAGDVVGPSQPDARGRIPAWGEPPSPVTVRAATLGDLHLVAGAIARADAALLAGRVKTELDAVAAGDPWAAQRAAALLGPQARDPVVAQALWARLDPEGTIQLLDAMAAGSGQVRPEWWQAQAGDLLVALGASLAVAANPAYARGADLGTQQLLDAWRGPWLATLAASTAGARSRPDGGAAGAAWAQGQLLTGARRAGLSPGAAYASTVGVAVVAADRAALLGPARVPGSGATHDVTATGRHVVVAAAPDDPVRALAEALAGDVEAARTWLLSPLRDVGSPGEVTGPRGPLVVDHLVGRYVGLARPDAAASMHAVGRLAAEAGSDSGALASVQAASAFLGAVAAEARSTDLPAAFRAALAPALADVGDLVAAHPDALTAALDDSAGNGVDSQDLAPADRLARPGRAPGTWEVVLADRAAAAALLGTLAFDGAGPDDTTARHPLAAPALARVVDALGQQLEDDLVAAVRAEQAGDAHAVEAAARRLGEAVGFTLTSAGEALAGYDSDVDARHAVLAGLADSGLDKVAIAGVGGKAAAPLVRLVGSQVVAAALPTGAEAAQREATAAALAAGREEAYLEMRAVVSRARPWTDAQSPARWAATVTDTPGAVWFWDDTGAPLPEREMTTAQRRSFTDWRRETGLSVYDTVPQQVRDGIDAGVRDVAAAPLLRRARG